MLRGAFSLTLLLSAGVQLSADDTLSCQTFSSANCACKLLKGARFWFSCNNRAFSIYYKVDSQDVKIIERSDSCNWTDTLGLKLEFVNELKLDLKECLFHIKGFNKMIENIGVKEMNTLEIKSEKPLRQALQKEHLENFHSVKYIYLRNVGVTTLPDDIFKGIENLTRLHLGDNHLSSLEGIFHFTPDIEELMLNDNHITTLGPEDFGNLKRLNVLDMTRNNIASIARDTFLKVSYLKTLDLQDNNISLLEQDLFSSLEQLKVLNLNKNPHLNLTDGLFSNLFSLESIDLSGCELRSVHGGAFKNCKNIYYLNLSSNVLSAIPEDAFQNLENLQVLDLSKNMLTSLNNRSFRKITQLRVLNLSSNKLTNLPLDMFPQRNSLEVLDLSFNSIKQISKKFFIHLASLRSLNVSNNRLTTLFEDSFDIWTDYSRTSILSPCVMLEELQLSHNALWRAFHEMATTTHLKTLNMSHNFIDYVQINAFEVNHLHSIDLSNNSIENPYISSMHHSKHDPKWHGHINLEGNPINCSCYLLNFLKFYSYSDYGVSISEDVRCHEPPHLKGTLLKDVQPQITCQIRYGEEYYRCPSNCTCHFRPWDGANVVDCRRAGIRGLPQSLPLNDEASHTELHLQGNYLTDVLVPAHGGYDNVTFFNLSHNHITSFAFSKYFKQIKVVDLANNRLSSLPPDTLAQLGRAVHLDVLSLAHNPWQCDCTIQPLVSLLSRIKHMKSNVACSNGTMFTELNELELCDGYLTSYTYILLICVACALVGVLAFLTAVYYHYREQILVYCYSSQWQFLRQLVSEPDTDHNKMYDAFISFANEDGDFVMQHLVPGLESDYRVCLHYRDWVVGELIPRQILWSVQNSRRTIVVLSPSFLGSVWGQMEFKTAHTVALQEGTSRLVVVLYRDVGPVDELDGELATYLKWYTYIKWDTPWFWEQLYYAMPHLSANSRGFSCLISCCRQTHNDDDDTVRYVPVNLRELTYT